MNCLDATNVGTRTLDSTEPPSTVLLKPPDNVHTKRKFDVNCFLFLFIGGIEKSWIQFLESLICTPVFALYMLIRETFVYLTGISA